MLLEKNSLGLYMFKWDDGYSLPIFNETTIESTSMKNGLALFKEAYPNAKVMQKYFICESFSAQEIIDNQSAIASISLDLYDICESIAYDVIDEDQRDLCESNLKILQDALEEEECIAEKIQTYLINLC